MAVSQYTYINPQSAQIYGADIQLDPIGDFMLGSSGDLALANGATNLIQAVMNRLATEVGGLAYDTTYGIDLSNIIGRKNIYEQVTMIKKYVEDTLTDDPRIQAILSIDVLQDTQNPSMLYIELSAMPINSQTPFSINMVFPWFSDNPTPTNLTTVTNEQQISLTQNVIKTQYDVYNCTGVWLQSDTAQTGTNYFSGGYVNKNLIYLGSLLPVNQMPTTITYSTLDTVYAPLKVTQITNEGHISLSATTIQTSLPIYDISWVGLASDINHNELNYWDAGVGFFTGNTITLGYALPSATSSVLVDYSTSVRVS